MLPYFLAHWLDMKIAVEEVVEIFEKVLDKSRVNYHLHKASLLAKNVNLYLSWFTNIYLSWFIN